MLCDKCGRRAVPDGEGERIICRWYRLVREAGEELRAAIVIEGDSPVYDHTTPEVTKCIGFDGETARVLSIVPKS